MTAELWRQDLAQLEQELITRHPSPFWKTPQHRLHAAFQDLAARVPSLDDYQIFAGIERLTALLGDGHTSAYPDDQPLVVFRYLPVSLWSFADGIYTIALPAPYKQHLGKKLVAIGGRDIREVFRGISRLIGADNPMEYEYTVPDLLIRPELLKALGYVTTTDSVTLVLEDSRGRRQRVRLPAVSAAVYDDSLKWVAARSDLGEVPSIGLRRLFGGKLNQPHLGEAYWYTVLDTARAVYFEYSRSVYLEDAAPLYRMLDELLRVLDAHPTYRLVIDLRNNAGGEPRTADSLLGGIITRPRLLVPGRVIELVSRRTFSAALTTAVDLRRLAHAVVIGEHPRGRPNSPSEGRDIVLDNSRILATVSTQWLERDSSLGTSEYLPLDREIRLRFADYVRGEDVVLRAALRR